MKTPNIITLIMAAIIYTILPGCSKEAINPDNTGGSGPAQNTFVTASSWFSAEWQAGEPLLQYIRSAPELTTDLWKNGKILAFGKGGFEMRAPAVLPSSFDANYISMSPETGYLKFILQGSGAVSASLQFRYILIPSDKLAPENSLDYQNYHDVCSYYHIPE